MPNHELPSRPDQQGQPSPEYLAPNHFYAAYVFDDAETRKYHAAAVIEEAQRLGYPVRYWWLSEAMELEGHYDRLIVCVHHPSNDENAGMDLYEALRRQHISWGELDKAAVEEYALLGRPIKGLDGIVKPNGTPLFSTIARKTEERVSSHAKGDEALFALSKKDIQGIAQEELGRSLTDGEIEAVMDNAVKVFEWAFIVANSIQACQEWGRVGPAAPGYERPREEYDEDDGAQLP